jgi:uncharacterized protein YodC (DUF2158 family)
MTFKTDLKTGDVVRLRSGSPLMTVRIVVYPDDTTTNLHLPLPGVYCCWADESGAVHQGAFLPDMLLVDRVL